MASSPSVVPENAGDDNGNINSQRVSSNEIVEFAYAGDSKDIGTEVPLDVQKLVIRPSAASVPNRFCEKRHRLNEVLMLEQEPAKENGTTKASASCRLRTIGEYSFAECLSLTRIQIPPTVAIISKNAFSNCKLLLEVDLYVMSAILKHVGFCAFYQCTSLIRISIPSTVEHIEGHAFHGCRSLAEVKMLAYGQKRKEPKLGSFVLGPSVFLECSSLQAIKIPVSLEKLSKSCFHTCSALREVSLPEGLIKIKANAFLNCASLEYVRIPSTVEVIQRDSFKGCKALEAVDFGTAQKPSILKEMEWEAFMECLSLRKVKIPSTLVVVKSSVFYGCTSLVEVDIPEGVKEIQHSAFGNCNALQAVILPQSIELVGIRAFASCPRLVTLEIPPTGLSRSFRIRKDAFVHCKAMINVSLPKSFTEDYRKHGPEHSFGDGVGENGFHGCTWLQKQYGFDLGPFLKGEVSRYGDDYPVHKLCYHSSVTSVGTLRQAIKQTQQSGKDDMSTIVDSFGMTPFHVLMSAGKRRVDLMEVLLEAYPSYILGWEDVTGKKAIDYCFLGWNWTVESLYMLQLYLQSYVSSRLTMWGGIDAWGTTLDDELDSILSEDNNDRQQDIWRETHTTFQSFEQIECISVLELGLWKRELMAHGNNGEAFQDAAVREVHRARCGSPILIPNVVAFLKKGP